MQPVLQSVDIQDANPTYTLYTTYRICNKLAREMSSLHLEVTSWFSIHRMSPSSSSGNDLNLSSASARGSHSWIASNESLKSSAFQRMQINPLCETAKNTYNTEYL